VDEGDAGQSPSKGGLAAVKERCKTFNASWEALHSAQASWSIPDVQLKNAVRHFIHQVGGMIDLPQEGVRGGSKPSPRALFHGRRHRTVRRTAPVCSCLGTAPVCSWWPARGWLGHLEAVGGRRCTRGHLQGSPKAAAAATAAAAAAATAAAVTAATAAATHVNSHVLTIQQPAAALLRVHCEQQQQDVAVDM
jgi:hypothetical protein